ncbi:MAG: MFS transporter [Solirubrobacteraceae bacterium]
MATTGTPDLRRARVAVTTIFAVNGAAFASLFARLPELQREQDLSDGALGLVLLLGALGLMVAQPVAGALAVRNGSRPLTIGGGATYVAVLALPALAPSPLLFALAIVLLAAANGALDVSMNAQAIAIEHRHPRHIFASFHAAFSFGAMAGAAGGALAAHAGLDPALHLAIAAAVLLAILFAVRGGLLPASADAQPEGPRLARPSRGLAALGALAFCALIAEGSVTDWSAILLDREIGTSAAVAALGLAAFSLTMGFGRLAADPLAERFGRVAVIRVGGLLAAAGLVLALAGDSAATGVAGFAVLGAGLAGGFPLALAAAGDTEGPAAPALAAVATTGYSGFIAGPALIGLLSEATSLPAALSVIVVLCLAIAVLAGAAAAKRPA